MKDKPNKSPYAYERKNLWDNANDTLKKDIESVSTEYKDFMNLCKTEREVTSFYETLAKEKGFSPLSKENYKPGAKLYYQLGNKNIVLIKIGKSPLSKGINFIASHTDAPRLDLKSLPLIEEQNISLLKTHYYGGIKKFYWVSTPLAIHGVIIRKDGTSVNIAIGEKESDPCFTIPDILIHLCRKVQGDKKLLDGIEGENLNLLVGSIPIEDKEVKDRVKAMVLEKLYEDYKITEEDFISAELEIVPSFPAKDVGFDRSMIGAYAHDDRSCSFAGAKALLDDTTVPEKTAIMFLVDKEEIGSAGISGATSPFLSHIIEELHIYENKVFNHFIYHEMLRNSACLSADVTAVLNPMFPQVHDSHMVARMNCGVVLEKYSGSGGKYNGSDASAELMSKVRKTFNEAKVNWQIGELGKVDEGGGGTIAAYIAEMGIPVVDCGVGVMAMHSPFEVISKADLYSTYKAYKAFFESI